MKHEITAKEVSELVIPVTNSIIENHCETFSKRLRPEQTGYPTGEEIAQGLLEALEAAGYVIVKKPEGPRLIDVLVAGPGSQ